MSRTTTFTCGLSHARRDAVGMPVAVGSTGLVARRAAGILAVAVTVLALLLIGATSASAAFSITAFSVSSTSSVAGAHPDVTTDLTFSTTSPSPGAVLPDGNVRDLTVDLPAGLMGDTTALPHCAQVAFSGAICPPAAQVGVASVTLLTAGNAFPITLPVYLMEPRNAEETAELAFQFPGFVTVQMPISVRTDGDFGLRVHAVGISHVLSVAHVVLTVWGVPADPSHDAQRSDMRLIPAGASQLARKPFMTNPSRCDAPLQFSARANSYQNKEVFSRASATLPRLTGCDSQPFHPQLSLQPTSAKAGAPSGYEATLTVPQNDNPDGVAAANLRTAKVTLPEGVAISPAGAVGIAGCRDADLRIGSLGPAACPDASRIGHVEIDVPVLPKPIRGRVYLRQPLPGDLFRIVIVADDFGVHLKIPGDVRPDAVTGQLTATFVDAPQVPFSRMVLDFDGGPHAPLVNPSACGVYTTRAALTPWSRSVPVVSESSFAIDQGCGQEGKFDPSLDAGVVGSRAGGSFPLTVTVSRPSGQQDIDGMDVWLPSGLLGKVGSVPLCPAGQAAAGSCGSASRIGRVSVAAGAGSAPLWVPEAGKAPTGVYLAGPYKGAPYSLSIVVPAQAGPFDLGTVVVRAAVLVDSRDARVSVKSDPIPTILQGVPLAVQKLNVTVDRPGFMRSPTSCTPMAIGATIASAQGAVAGRSSRFQVGDCAALALAPKMRMDLVGKKETKRGKHPTLSTTLTQQPGESGLKKVKVRLPLSLALDPDNAQALCTPGQAAAKACPAGSIVGHATAVTPVLDQPLKGDVFFVEGTRKSKTGRTIKTLPKLWVALRGEVAIDLWADSSISKGKYLVTTFPFVPDAPISSFKLDIDGGQHGILAVTGASDANLCKQANVTQVTYDGQNGKQVTDNIRMTSPCGFRVRSKTLTNTHAKVTLSGLGAGKLSISGKGIHRASRTIKHSDVATITPRLTESGMRTAKRGKALRLRVTWNPKKKGAKTRHARATIKRAKKASSTRAHRTHRTR